MASYSLNRFVVTFSFRAAGRRPNCSSKVSQWDVGGARPLPSQRWFSTSEPEQIPVHTIAGPTADAYKLEQRRNVSTAELDKYRDTRERIVILGSGWAGYTLSKEIDHRKYQVVIVSKIVHSV
jgi:hypothetical protein